MNRIEKIKAIKAAMQGDTDTYYKYMGLPECPDRVFRKFMDGLITKQRDKSIMIHKYRLTKDQVKMIADYINSRRKQ